MSMPVDLDTLRDAIPAAARRWIYLIWGGLLIAALATQVGYAAADARQPVQLTVVLAVLSYLGIVVAALAVVNTKPQDTATVQVKASVVAQPQGSPYVAYSPPKHALDADGDGQPDYANDVDDDAEVTR